jgi:hypothetical protein
VALLGELGDLEVGLAVLEIGAGILLVAVQEERVEPPVEIVVMGDVPLRLPRRVDLAEAAGEETELGAELHQGGRVAAARVDEDRLHEVVDRAGLEVEAAVHELLAELEAGIEDHVSLGAGPIEPDAHRRQRAVAVGMRLPGRIDDLDRPLLDRTLQECVEESVHCAPRQYRS